MNCASSPTNSAGITWPSLISTDRSSMRMPLPLKRIPGLRPGASTPFASRQTSPSTRKWLFSTPSMTPEISSCWFLAFITLTLRAVQPDPNSRASTSTSQPMRRSLAVMSFWFCRSILVSAPSETAWPSTTIDPGETSQRYPLSLSADATLAASRQTATATSVRWFRRIAPPSVTGRDVIAAPIARLLLKETGSGPGAVLLQHLVEELEEEGRVRFGEDERWAQL